MYEPTLKNLTNVDYGKPPDSQNQILQELGTPHIDSFNYMIEEGLNLAISDLLPVEFDTKGKYRVKLTLLDATIHQPRVPSGSLGVKSHSIYPLECRQRHGTYSGRLEIKLRWSINDAEQMIIDRDIGQVPIMLKSKLCHLEKMSPKQLVNLGEHQDEWGGYFIVKGKERLVRLLLGTRRNFPTAVQRNTWKNKDQYFSDIGILIRCVKDDLTTVTNNLHYLTNGTAKLMIPIKKRVFYAPIILIMKCLTYSSDEFIFRHIIKGHEDDLYFIRSVMEMMRSLHESNIHCQEDAKEYVGILFRPRFYELPEWKTNKEVCDHMLRNYVLIHLNTDFDKFKLLVFMLQKLFSVAQNKCLIEGADGIMMQELMLGGHLYLKILKEKLQLWLNLVKINLLKIDQGGQPSIGDMMTALRRCDLIEHSLTNFFATGNLNSQSGLGMQQDKGLTILVENISRMRYMAHFRAVHRGAIFESMRTTEPRRLLPDAWGFICPVHTPDGTPCGLLNHLTKSCIVTKSVSRKILRDIPKVLISLGMCEASYKPQDVNIGFVYNVILDGRIIGYVPETLTALFIKKLRTLKVKGKQIPETTEIVWLQKKGENILGQFPGLFLFTGNARMMRPVFNLDLEQIELIGTFEQVYLDISISEDEIRPNITSYREVTKTDFLSHLACLIPLPDYNQSPRNMYQCQMGKQTMGTACHNWHLQSETKLYRIQTPASPLFRPVHYDALSMDDFAMGTNAIIAVISYTGYDMEDAMIINKMALDRGFAHGSIFKTELIETKPHTYFMRDPFKEDLSNYLGLDGLPHIGLKLSKGTPYYSYFDEQIQGFIIAKYLSNEEVIVDSVRQCGDFTTGRKIPNKATITVRVQRNPTVGDKFASRAGQKGIFSKGWPSEDLPFTESGMVPDIVFNPHGFPSRMTIAMMIECMAGKSAAVHGVVHDATPFKYSEEDTAIDFFGKLLEAGGYNYFGTEQMYSGVDGRAMKASIFFGVVHYQRLRHMVSDKWQVRSTGPVDAVTKQPVKGRKRGGGGRVGEMERDALISHGTPFLMQDRFMDCSDKSTALLCLKCHTILSSLIHFKEDSYSSKMAKCRTCDSTQVQEIGIPNVFRYLCSELAAINIKLQLNIEV
ncbi:DNA-directed RNA polymerase I subunit RPA2 [Rhopalosiphum padi]|uniref:DNA-directed RNA polymerase I subunit RPA2 n=1 Tax=Rhopalosiphum padi TaxID=40932 RepID=UPI00298E0378|nr:DNA-directed RNA polymerase I subunit RPA2 [Rhopalosiphum padi]